MTPVAKKKKVTAKAKRKKEITEVVSPKAAAKREREIKDAMDRLDERAKEHFQFAARVLEKQDDATRNAVDHMVTTMKRIAGPPVFKYEGHSINADEAWMRKVQEHNFTYIAVRLLVACAEFDIRIANFKPLKKRCGKCGKKVSK